jgi:calcineurin-like phosphoesterase family protein
MSRDIWLISDTHFGHKNIIKFTDREGIHIRRRMKNLDGSEPLASSDGWALSLFRPFNDIHEHNQYLTEKWNSVVKPQDHVWHGGDFGSFQAKRHLNGVINLIVGNHDEDFQHYVNGEEYEVQVELEPLWRPEGSAPESPRFRIEKRRCPGFKKIRESRLWSEAEHHVAGLRFLQTHRPTNMLPGGDVLRKFQFNVHGHTHGHNPTIFKGQDNCFYNISVEQLKDYTPVHIEEVAKELKKRLK